jgi:hypothetical protein
VEDGSCKDVTVIDQKTATMVAEVERAVSLVPRESDREIHELVSALRRALESQDRRSLGRIAGQIVDHATYRYAAVVEEADRLVRHLGEAV